jgi:hypothetical protein
LVVVHNPTGGSWSSSTLAFERWLFNAKIHPWVALCVDTSHSSPITSAFCSSSSNPFTKRRRTLRRCRTSYAQQSRIVCLGSNPCVSGGPILLLIACRELAEHCFLLLLLVVQSRHSLIRLILLLCFGRSAWKALVFALLTVAKPADDLSLRGQSVSNRLLLFRLTNTRPPNTTAGEHTNRDYLCPFFYTFPFALLSSSPFSLPALVVTTNLNKFASTIAFFRFSEGGFVTKGFGQKKRRQEQKKETSSCQQVAHLALVQTLSK